MDNLDALVPMNGLAANVEVARKLIEEDDLTISQLQREKERLILLRDRRELLLRTTAKDQRDELLRRIEAVNDREKRELEQLSAAFEVRKAPLEERIQLLKANIDTAKAAIAPIRTLPAEIISHIFREFVELNQPLWILAMVSRSWRQITFSTPWLWRYLYVGNLLTPYGYTIPRRLWRLDGYPGCSTTGNRLVCHRLDHLQSWAKNTGSVPLDVELNTSLERLDVKILQYLLAESLSSRIQSLSISVPKAGVDVEVPSIGRFPLLRRVSIKSPNGHAPPQLIESIFRQSPRIEEFTSQISLRDFLPGHRFWNSIRVLSLSGMAPSSQINQITGALTVVESMLGLPSAWPDMMTPRATLARVRSISLICQPECLARLRFPQLETLQLRDLNPQQLLAATTNPSNQNDFSWQLPMPKLVDLTFFGADAMWLSRLTAPALQTMAWERQYFHPVQTAFPRVEFPNVENFSFDADCNDEILQSALDCFPNVQILSVGPGMPKGCGDKWALALLRWLLSSEFLPRLRRLTLGNEGNRAGTNKLLAKPLIKGLIQSRTQQGAPIEHLEVAWTKRNSRLETIQYVK